MKRFYISIRWKFFIAIALTVSLFALLNIALVWTKVYEVMDEEVAKRIINLGKNLSNQSIHYILYDDLSSLQKITENTKNSDNAIIYCFITDNRNNVIAHTFTNGFPIKLLEVNPKGKKIRIEKIETDNFQTKRISDLMIPILDGKIGSVRIGIDGEGSWNELESTMILFVIIFSVFTFMGFAGAYIFSYIISKPIKRIKQAAESIDMNSLTKYTLAFGNDSFSKDNLKAIMLPYDEIDDLSDNFEQMLFRLKTTYQKLEDARNSMNQSEKLASIGTLVSGIAHEINNPLSGLRSCIRRITDQPENYSQNIKYLSIMNEAVSKIEFVVKGLLDFTRKSSGLRNVNKISSLIDNSLRFIQFGNKHTKLITKGNFINSDYLIICDKNEIEQVFFNLIKNSYDAIDEKMKILPNHLGVIDINISQNEENIEVEIYDNGIGIKDENLKKVFDPFYTSKDIGKGTGLGCAISYNLIHENGGIIEIDSVYGEWTKIKIKFPKEIR
jgi:two-component system NtrC family sensor kinase